MGPPTNLELNAKREEHCIQVTPERKYYRYADTWVKRSLKPSEWQKHGGYMFVPKFSTERVLNEGACLAFLAEHTEIPVPRIYACFEDDGAAYLITEFVEGTPMSQLPPEQQKHVVIELEQHLETLKQITSPNWGGPTGHVLPPYRVMRRSKGHPWHMRPRDDDSLVFCHNDLSASNVLVDPYTLKINAIVDWEYAGFYPPEFDSPFYLRAGPPVALQGEYDDVDELCRIIDSERVYLENQQHTAPQTPVTPYGPPGARGSGQSANGGQQQQQQSGPNGGHTRGQGPPPQAGFAHQGNSQNGGGHGGQQQGMGGRPFLGPAGSFTAQRSISPGLHAQRAMSPAMHGQRAVSPGVAHAYSGPNGHGGHNGPSGHNGHNGSGPYAQ
ncbi:hypothetical protein MGG_11537 [Pyricularia oryzae 70-15]|uniref:Aminoglycoside phosphotransferase domain-containing protein n=3 Tax=Pyricularia oryzae TaxID=318829 RepID=G4NB46_PYRO7|nr:uncharacterized protein MGG_11537 [Pyricularia oryzae 70-15]EHA48808.1 hypothetical protein MGG_11537 [Pyricularia oryzae 70-15]ELQ38710.1 hypothetical protein OOU_Y34scaffold00528g2 [Pyricularia oryzae Y34]KAI7925562.1 hypothetical protein M0657_004135 [Pyricularia oryzae]KAI7926633.1 hypothetical protein M9X92_002647 [Pyricularia oryzae]